MLVHLLFLMCACPCLHLMVVLGFVFSGVGNFVVGVGSSVSVVGTLSISGRPCVVKVFGVPYAVPCPGLVMLMR